MSRALRKKIHIHQQRLRQGLPSIIVRTYKGSTYHRVVKILGPATLVQPETPDSCGARAWLETSAEVETD